MAAISKQHADNKGPKSLANCPVAPSDLGLEAQLARILTRVPPILTLPKPKTRCPWTGESRTGLAELVTPCDRNGFKPPVRAIYKRAHTRARRGQWLIPAENLFRYLLTLAEHSEEHYLAAAEARIEAKRAERRGFQ